MPSTMRDAEALGGPSLGVSRETPGTISDYIVIHLVVQETTKPLIGSQVLDNMQSQITMPGPGRPTQAMVFLLEPLRALFKPEVRKAVRSLRGRAPGVHVSLLPYVSRLTVERNVTLLAHYVKRYARDRSVVFHCRGERAVEWARALSRRCAASAIVADIRGPWPEELRFARSRSDTSPDLSTLREYEQATRNLIAALGSSQRTTTVSDGMREWLLELGVAPAKTSYIPCCVPKVAYDEELRARMRERLGFSHQLVLAYAGAVNRFQYLTDGLGEFVSRAFQVSEAVHFMAITPDRRNMLALLADAGVDQTRTSIIQLPQERVSNYLMAADAGLILGKPSVLKKVVQPVKFAEYLSAGLPVIASRGTLGVDALVAKYQAGVLVDFAEGKWSQAEIGRALDTIRDARAVLQAGALRLCREELLWDRYATAQREAYVDALAMAKSGATCLRAERPKAEFVRTGTPR